jgi:Phage tail sheath protein subtilisin-like domain
MTAPGVRVQVQTLPPPRSVPTDSGVAFMAGITYQGKLKAQAVQSLDQFVTIFGPRQTFSILYDAVDCFFREGGNTAYIGRVVGPNPVYATHTLLDGSSGNSLIVNANSPGAWGNAIKVAVLTPLVSGYRIQIQDSSGNPLETSPDLTTQADAVSWASQYSNYVTIAVGGGSNPPAVVAGALLTSGNDDHANAVDAQWLNALNLFTSDLGPGQVLAPGRTTATGQGQLSDHAAANNRIAICDLPDDPVVANLVSDAAAAGGTANEQYSAVFTPWLRVAGVTAGTTRVVPPSGAVAGVIARNDGINNAGTAAAGNDGQFQSVIGLSQAAFTDSQRDTLNTGGVNVIRPMLGGFRIYGYRSLADPIQNPAWLQLTVGRYLMDLVARCKYVGENYVFRTIDGQGHTQADYAGDLGALCQADYQAGILYGQSASDAYNVDTGPTVNTPTTIANGELRAVVAVRPSPFAELVTVLIVNTPITQAVS